MKKLLLLALFAAGSFAAMAQACPCTGDNSPCNCGAACQCKDK